VVDLGMLSLRVGQVGLACLCALAAGLLSSCATTLPLEDSEIATVDRIADPGGGFEEVPLWEDPGIDVYVADDLPPELGEIIQETLEVASEEWGLYWPVEYWILGVNEAAGMQLVTKFCERREELAQWNFDDCMEREAGSEQHSMIEYQQLGAEALDAGEPFGTAGWNGAPDWGIHRFASTQPWGLTELAGVKRTTDQKVGGSNPSGRATGHQHQGAPWALFLSFTVFSQPRPPANTVSVSKPELSSGHTRETP
jgi:hypothetical protein